MENTMKMYVTADEAAQILGVSRGYAYKIIERKRLSGDFRQGTYKIF